jgi:type II restriction enzyme
MSARNVGEWSEIYAIARLLAGEIIVTPVGKSFQIDAAQLQHSVSESPMEYKVTNETISLTRDNRTESKVEQKEISELATLLLTDIRRKSTRTFESRSGNALTELLGFSGASAVLRDDVRVRYGAGRAASWRGLSIKSFLGARPTLLNASPATNFVFKLSGSPLTLKHVAKLGHLTMRPLFKYLNDNSVSLEFVSMDSKTFEQSLRSFSPRLGTLVANLLRQAALQRKKLVKEVWIEVAKSCRRDGQIVDADFLNFLGAVGLGLQPATRWVPRGADFGGFLIVNVNGDVELLDETAIEALGARLFNELRFEWGSRARHKFGVPYQVDGEVFLKLNLQLRF